jgi:tetrahydromethanopterin S-methyltransferase subunit G
MADYGTGSTSFMKSVTSFLDALRSFEREAVMLMGKAATGKRGLNIPGLNIPGLNLPGLGLLGAGVSTAAVASLRSLLSGSAEGRARASAGGQGRAGLVAILGLADRDSLEELSRELGDLGGQVSELRERELANVGILGQLRARAARFESAVDGLARVQGRSCAVQDRRQKDSDGFRELVQSRDDHVTRLLRDTSAQRARLEQLDSRVERLSTVSQAAGETVAEDGQMADRVDELDSRLGDFRKIQSNGAHRVAESLDLVRERLGRLEARTAEVSREARIKTGRLDALARHVAVVDGRLASAIGKQAATPRPLRRTEPASIMVGERTL